jgi:hypothetical protein
MSVPVNAYHVGWQLVAWHTALLAHHIGTDGWVLPQSQGPLIFFPSWTARREAAHTGGHRLCPETGGLDAYRFL